MTNTKAELLEVMTTDIQSQCHLVVESAMRQSKKNITYQDSTNVFIFQKLAELQIENHLLKLELKELKIKNQ